MIFKNSLHPFALEESSLSLGRFKALEYLHLGGVQGPQVGLEEAEDLADVGLLRLQHVL